MKVDGNDAFVMREALLAAAPFSKEPGGGTSINTIE